MANRENRLSNLGIGCAFLLAVTLIVAILLIRLPFPPTAKTPSALTTASTLELTTAFIGTPTAPSTPRSTTTSAGISTATSTPFPTPMRGAVGTNLPPGFYVGPWHDNYIKCNMDQEHRKVKIYGVEISHGTRPYEFTFWQGNNTAAFFGNNIITSSKIYVEFRKAVVVSRGEYVHVVLTFNLTDTTLVTWIDDLYYPYPEFFPSC